MPKTSDYKITIERINDNIHEALLKRSFFGVWWTVKYAREENAADILETIGEWQSEYGLLHENVVRIVDGAELGSSARIFPTLFSTLVMLLLLVIAELTIDSPFRERFLMLFLCIMSVFVLVTLIQIRNKM